MAKTTTIAFDQAGNMQVDHVGFVGKTCAETTERLIGGLKSTVVDEKKKPEFNQLVTGKAGGAQRWEAHGEPVHHYLVEAG